MDLNVQDAALRHGFGHLLDFSRGLEHQPIIASLQNQMGENEQQHRVKLNVLTGRGKDLLRWSHTLISGTNRATSLGVAGEAFDNRAYNRKTGEWIGLCDPQDPACCSSCQNIYRSSAANNFYDAAG